MSFHGSWLSGNVHPRVGEVWGGDLPNMAAGKATMNRIMCFLLQGLVFQPAMLVYSVLGRCFVHGAQKIWWDLVCNLYGGYPK